MCFFFFLSFYYVNNFYIEKKKKKKIKSCSPTQLRGRSVKIKSSLWLIKKKNTINEGLLMKLGVTVSCL